MKSITAIVFVFALFVEINSSPEPCDDGCDEGGSFQHVAIPMSGRSSFKQSKMSFGGPDSLGPVTAAVKAIEDTFDHAVGYTYDFFSGSATGAANQAAHLHEKETLVVPVKTSGGGGGGSDDSCDECEEKKSESDCDSC